VHAAVEGFARVQKKIQKLSKIFKKFENLLFEKL